MPRKSPTLDFDKECIHLKRGFQEAFEGVIEDRQKPRKVRLLASAQGVENGFSLSNPVQVIESDVEDFGSPAVRNGEDYSTALSHAFTEPCNCTETRLRLVPREQSSKRIIILSCYTVENGRPVRGEIHFNADDAIAEAPGMKTILAEDRQKKEEALTVLTALMTDRRTHNDKAIVYLLSQDIVRPQHIEEDIDVSIEYLRSVVLEWLQVHDRIGTLERDKQCALSRDCFEGIWNARGRHEAASARIEELGIARNKPKQGNRNSVAPNWSRTVPALFPIHHLSSSRLDSWENCPFPFAHYFTRLTSLKESLLQESYGHLVEFHDEREATGEDTSATDACFIFTIVQAMDQQLDTAACTLNRAAEFWRRSKEAKDIETYTRLLRGHSEELCEMANIFNQANLVVESTTKQGTSQCTNVKARASKAGRKLGELNRLHQPTVLGQQAQAESDDTIAGECQAIFSKDGLDDHSQALVKRGEVHTVQPKAQAAPGETKAGGDEATVATTYFEEQSRAEAKAEELEEQPQAMVRTAKAHTIQQKARWVLKEPGAEEPNAGVGMNQLEEEKSQVEVKANADSPVRMPNEEYWEVDFFDIVVVLLLMHVRIFCNIVAVLLIIHFATKLWDLL